VTNNTFYRAYQPDQFAGDGVIFYGENNQFATHRVLLVNNIIANNAHNGVHGSGPSEKNDQMRTNVVRNNLAWDNPDGDFDSNYEGATLFTLGPGNITGKDPLFLNPSELDFRLRSGSPAGGRSIPEYTPATDFTGRLRKARPDLGAIEIVSR
jgi:hypothetical protein